ncbi:MAG: hypothetical protein IT308_12960 [Anaerolineaceae bacterium]|nr:hypothetical protein [Anaerolineaceae bacterium]
MARQPLFSGLIEDEFGQAVTTALIGTDPCYVVNDSGFLRHIPSEEVDRQVLRMMKEQIQDHEGSIADQAVKMLGADDIFSRALIMKQLKQIDEQFETLLQTGIPEETRAYMGMAGFRITINVHGDVIALNQPGTIGSEDEE